MSETNDLTYAALITISMPGDGESISVPVLLSPADSVAVGGQRKRLADCTLADLRAYAAELERDVWEAYEAITLPLLDDDAKIAVEVFLSGDPGEPVLKWTEQILLVPVEDEGPEAEEVSGEVQEASGEAQELSGEVQEASDEAEEERVERGVAVAETELVYPEIETEAILEEEAPAKERPVIPEIIPSKARVRVAGTQLPIGHPTWAAVDILIDEPALRATQAHAMSSMQREVAGVLVGPRPEKQPDGRYLVHIIDTIVAKHTVMQGASVTYTPESWRYLNDTLMERYPDDTAVMAGWYHTHPGFGIFLSGMDLFIHQNFFTQIWHVAMVLDPRARTSGFFCWDRPKSKVSRCDFAWPSWAAGSW